MVISPCVLINPLPGMQVSLISWLALCSLFFPLCRDCIALHADIFSHYFILFFSLSFAFYILCASAAISMGITLNFDLVTLFSAKPAGLCLLLFSSLFAAPNSDGRDVTLVLWNLHVCTHTPTQIAHVQMSDIVARKLKKSYNLKFKRRNYPDTVFRARFGLVSAYQTPFTTERDCDLWLWKMQASEKNIMMMPIYWIAPPKHN